jgi:hypothetical protein
LHRAGAVLAVLAPVASLVPAVVMAAAALPAPGLDGTPIAPVAADDRGWQVTLAAGGEAGTAASAGGVGVDARAAAIGDYDDVDGVLHVQGIAATGGTASLRAGGPGWLAASHWAHLSYDALPTDDGTGIGLFTGAIEHHLDVGAVPSLFASRDAVRAGFAREQLGFTARGLSLLWDGGDRRVDLIDEGMALAWTWQPDGRRRREAGMHGEMVRYCRARSAAPAYCADVLRFTAQVGGAADTDTGGGVVAIAPLALAGVHAGGDVYLDLAGGLEIGGGARIDHDGGGGSIALPSLAVASYDLGLHAGLGGGARLDARAFRHVYVTLDDELSLEDRVDAGVTVPTARTQIVLRGFAARTIWWSSADAPGTAAFTGGGELAIARRDAGLDWNASLGLARSFYATPDGAAAGPPSLGARGALEVRRALRRPRPAP